MLAPTRNRRLLAAALNNNRKRRERRNRDEAPEQPEQPATYAGHVLADGPALYWPLDEWSGGVFDRSGNDRNAAAINITGPMRSEPGPLRSEPTTCFRFDGAARHVLSAVTAADLNIDGTKPKTVEAWVRADGLGITFTGAWEIGSRVQGQYLSLSHTDAATGYAISTYGANADFTAPGHGEWMLVHVTYDPDEPTADKLRAYVNGALAVQSALPASLGAGIPFLVGALDGRQFVGAVAEVAVFDAVLPVSRMLERHQLAGIGTLPVPYQSEVLADRPRLYWRNHLPDETKHLTPDLSGWNLGGDVFYVTRSQESALLNDPADTSFGWTGLGHGPGKEQELIQSNGLEASGFADGTTLGIAGAAASWTVEAWVRPTGVHNYLGVWEMGLKAAGQFVALCSGGNDGRLYLHTWGGAPMGAGLAVPWDEWSLVHVCYDHADTTFRVHLNGAATPGYTLSFAVSLPGTGWTFSTGRLDANQWLGLIDETAVYQGVLPEARRAARWTASGRS